MPNAILDGLILEQLHAMRADIARLAERQEAMLTALARAESVLAAMRRGGSKASEA
jgi:hypothetical protein